MAISNPVITDSDWLQATAVAIQNKDGGSKMEVPDFAGRIDAFPTNQPLFSINGTMYFEEMKIPNTVTSIKNGEYQACLNMRKLEIAGSVKTIGSYAFSNTPITELILNEGIETFSESAFSHHQCKIIAFPSSAKTISAYAFASIRISDQVVDLSAFVDLNNLPTLVNSNAFADSRVLRYEVANQSMLDAFAAATNWSIYSGKYVIKGAS